MEAIVTDAPQSDVKTKHDTDYEALLARRQAEQVKTEPEPEPEPIVEPEELTIDLVDAKGNTIKVPASARYRAKIDGQEVEVPFDKITRSYQVGAAADQRLERATKKEREVEAREKEINERRKSLTAQEESMAEKMKAKDEQAGKQVKTDDTYLALAGKMIEALTDENNADKALAEVLRGLTPQQAVNYEEIAAKAKQEALAEIDKREQERESKAAQAKAAERAKKASEANQRFANEYSDVIEDSFYYDAAKDLAKKKWQARPDADPWEIASEVGNEVRKKMPAKAKEEPKPNPKPAPIPRVATGRASIGKDPEPVTRESTIKEMKKQRGQPV